MSFLNDRFDIYSNNSYFSVSGHLNEDLSIDDLFTASDIRSQDILADKTEDDSVREDFEHFMRIQFRMPTDVKTPTRIKSALIKFIEEYIRTEMIPVVLQNRHISAFEFGWTNMESLTFSTDSEKFFPLTKTREYFTETPNALTGRHLNFILMFNVIRPERVRHIFSVLNVLYNIKRLFGRVVSTFSASIDNWPSFVLDSDVMDDINNRQYTDRKREKSIKHFVDVFTKSRKTKKELAEYMSPMENYMGSGQAKFNTHVAFLDGTAKNVIFSPSDDETLSKCPIAFIPEGKTARCRYFYHDVFVQFRVAGTLIVWHRFDLKSSSFGGGFRNDNYGLKRLDPNYHHNTLVIEIEFDTYPVVEKDKKIAVMIHSRHIDNLIIRANDQFLEDINHLKDLVELQDIENVKNIEWEFLEND